MTEDRNSNVTQGETHGPDQEPREVGEADPATRAPRPGGPMDHPTDQDQANDEFGQGSDAAFGQREGQADPETDPPS